MEKEQISNIGVNIEKQTVVESREEIPLPIKLDDINQEIAEKQNNINNTMKSINDIRNELGIPQSNEIPPSLKKDQESIDKLNIQKSNLEGSDFNIIDPSKEETPEEYISRSMKNVVDENLNKNQDFNNLNRLVKKAYYGNHANQEIEKFFSNKENSIKIKDVLTKLEINDDAKFSEDKNNEIFLKLDKKITSSSKDSGMGGNNEKIDYYANTNQTREFFSYGRKHDAYSYSSMMYGLPENFINTEEGKEYLHNKIDDKTIFLFGGGDSIKDLLKSEEFKPKEVINFDPFIKEEAVDKNPNGIYKSLMISASDEKIRNMELPKADEVWATYSVPFYLDSKEDIKGLITNMSSVLKEGGNARFSPIAVQSIEKDGENFESRKEALMDSIKHLIDSSEYNVSIFNDTLKIHKIKKHNQ